GELDALLGANPVGDDAAHRRVHQREAAHVGDCGVGSDLHGHLSDSFLTSWGALSSIASSSSVNLPSVWPRLVANVTTFSAGCDHSGCKAWAASRHRGIQVDSHDENSALFDSPNCSSRVRIRNRFLV